MSSAVPTTVVAVVDAARRRLRARYGAALVSFGAPLVAGICVALVALTWVTPWVWPQTAAAAVVVISVVGWLWRTLRQPISRLGAASVLDRRCRTHDALGAGLVEVERADAFGAAIRDRAVAAAEATSVPAILPVRLDVRRLLVALALALIAVAGLVVPNRHDEARAAAAAEQRTIAAATEELEDLVEELGDEPLAEETADQLEALLAELDGLDDIDTALEELRTAQSQLDLATPRSHLSQRAATSGLERSLDAQPLPGAASGAAADQLDQLSRSMEDLTAEETAALADRLDALAATQAAGSPAVSAAMAAAADAVRSGDLGAAASALAEASAAHRSQSDQVERGDTAARAADATRRAAEDLAEHGEGGQGQGQGQGEGQGQGQGAGQGRGGGQPSGEVAGSTGGTGAGQGGQGQSGQTGDNPGARGEEPEVAPPLEGEGFGDPLDLAGAAGGEPGAVVGEGDTRSGPGVITRSQAETLAEFADRAAEALDSLQLSPTDQQLVARYFEHLNEEAQR